MKHACRFTDDDAHVCFCMGVCVWGCEYGVCVYGGVCMGGVCMGVCVWGCVYGCVCMGVCVGTRRGQHDVIAQEAARPGPIPKTLNPKS